MPHRSSPTVVFALDAGDVDSIRKWSKDGFLPTMSKIFDNGVLKTFADGELLNEMGSWFALFSGVSKAEFNYHHIRELIPHTYKLRGTNSTQVTNVEPFWCHLARSAVKALIIDPPDLGVYANLPGVQLSHWTPHESNRMPKTLQAVPEQLIGEVKRRHKRYSFPAFLAGTTPERDMADLDLSLESIRSKGEVCRELIARDDFDLIVIGFNQTHNMGHRLFGYQDDASIDEKLRGGLRENYQAIDREIGRILAELPEQTNVLVVSAYGMNYLYPTNELIGAFLEALGYHERKRDSGKLPLLSADLSGLRNIISPALRRRLSVMLPVWAQERLIASSFEQMTDWSRTRAYSIDSLYTSLIRINLKGREPAGIVEPGAEYHDVIDQIEADLKLLIDPQTGTPAIAKVYRTCEVFGCDPHPVLPDIFVEWSWARHFRNEVHHPRTRLTQKKPAYYRSSWHPSSGFLAACGPCIEPGSSLSEFGTLDFAPTMLSLLNVPTPDKMKGKPIGGFNYSPAPDLCQPLALLK